MLFSLLSFKIKIIKKFFERNTAAKIITALLFSAVFWFVISGIYFFLVTGLRFALFQMTGDSRNALVYFLYESFYFTLFLLTVLSATISLLFSFFRTKKDLWLMASPGFANYPWITLIKTLSSTLVPTLILFTPLNFALSHVIKLSILETFILYTSFILLTVLTVSILASFILFTAKILTKIRRILTKKILNFRELLLFFFTIFFITSLYGISSLQKMDLTSLFKVDTNSATLETEDIAKHFSWTPSHIVATQALCITLNNKDEVCKGSPVTNLIFLTLASLALFTILIPTHFPLWKQFQNTPSRLFSKLSLSKNNLFSGSSTKAMFEREYMSITRDLKSFFWLLFLVALWTAEILVHNLAKHTYAQHGISFDEHLPRIIATQAMITLYFISAFTLRFVYPSFNIEKNMKWILWTSPISLRKRYLIKLFFFSVFFTSLGVIVNIMAALALSFSLPSLFHSLILLLPALVVIVSSGLSFGTFFGGDEGDDAESATTSIPGLFFTGMSLLYGAAGTYALFLKETKTDPFFLFIYATISVILFTLITLTSLWHLKGRTP